MKVKGCRSSFNHLLVVFLVYHALSHVVLSTSTEGVRQERTSGDTCGGNILEESGVIQSPNYPRSYPAFQHCLWVITVPESHVVQLTFQDFKLETADNCKYDAVLVFDGPSSSSPVLGSFCGTVIPNPIQSSGNKLTLYFRSDILDHFTGFSAVFTKVLKCGGNFTSEGGYMVSPNFPNEYGPNEDCTWLITAPESYQVILKFQSFELEGGTNCAHDYVEVRDGNNSNSSRVLGKFCGDNVVTQEIRSTENKMAVRFHTDRTVNRHGFFAEYETGWDTGMQLSSTKSLPSGFTAVITMYVIGFIVI